MLSLLQDALEPTSLPTLPDVRQGQRPEDELADEGVGERILDLAAATPH